VAYNTFSAHSWRLSKPPSGAADLVLGPGRVELTQTVTIKAGGSLRVASGTDLKMGPGVSLVVRGRFSMEGTADAPVTVGRLDPDHPWGGILVFGAAAKGSAIRYASIAGGSSDTIGLLPLLGMVNVHWTRDFVIEHTRIMDNVQSDDTLHIVHSDFRLEDVELRNCFGDCIDLDYAKGRLVNLRITGSGNDGVDFMASEVTISGLHVNGAGDKGFSVGEKSRVTARDGLIEGSQIGIAVKDASYLDLALWRLRGNRLAMDVYKNNWRYGRPGSADLADVAFEGNGSDLRVAKKGRVTVHGNSLPAHREGDGSVVLIREPNS
jgi:hypothetical protein